jgi:protein TonB
MNATRPTHFIPALLLSCTLGLSTTHAQTEGTCMAVGGKPALDKLFEQELQFPAVALEAGIKGEVVITIHLQPDGAVKDVAVGRSLSPECDVEALRLIRMVRWKPTTAGELCAGKDHYLAVPFDPAKYKRWTKGRHARTNAVFQLPADTANTVYQAKQLDGLVAPEIPNGMQGLPRYIADHMKYPPEAYRYSIDGTVRLEFVVEPTGTLSNMQVIEDVGGGCTDEAMRLIHRMAWLPGQKAGKRVRSLLQVSIRFDLPKEAR